MKDLTQRTIKQKTSVVQALAVAIASSDWIKTRAKKNIRGLFRKRQDWIPGFVERTFGRHPDRVPFADLVKSVGSDRELLDVIKQNNIRPIDIRPMLGRQSIASLDWGLPHFDSKKQLASHFDISLRTLQWLTSRHLNPDDRPRHYVSTWIKKRSSGLRLIESPKIQLKQVQRFILLDIVDGIPVHPKAHGFCRRRNVRSFTQPHLNQPFCLRMDLKDFFPSVTEPRVNGIFRSSGFDQTIATALSALCTVQTHCDVIASARLVGKRGACEQSRLYLRSHLPQGSPTSPALANLAAYDLDCRLEGLAKSIGINYSRYADDLLFSGDRNFSKTAHRFSILIGTIALEEGFEVNFRKTRFQFQSQRQMAAGVVLNQHANLDRKKFDRLKATLFNCVQKGPNSQNLNRIPDFRNHLLGRINWLQQLNSKRAEKLMRLFDQIEWESA